MIDSVTLRSFKCFEEQTVRLGNLTVLSGVNSAGKSSVLQALVLAADLVSSSPWKTKLDLNRPGLKLGCASDVFSQTSSRDSMAIGFESGSEAMEFHFQATDRQALSMEFRSLLIIRDGKQVSKSPTKIPNSLHHESQTINGLCRLKWISSERIGPRDILPLQDSQSVFSVGHDGGNASGLVYWNEDKEVNPRVSVQGLPNTLYNQVRARLREFFPQSDFRVVRLDNAIAVSLSFRTSSGSEFQRPQNVGFGYSQVFPLLVELLFASPGDVVLIENPEIHLHPRAQQELAFFIALVASSGVQVLVETHSDHILNGIRLAVRNRVISHSGVAIHFFAPNKEGHPMISSPSLDGSAKLSEWPDGFFDQYDLALSELL